MSGNLLIIERKKIIWTLVMLFGVVIPLLIASYNVPLRGVTGQSDKMVIYESDKEGIKFEYPQNWLIRTERDFSGGEIIESVSFISPDQAAHGFAQVMQLPKSIPDYINDSQKSMTPGYDSFQLKSASLGNRQGYVLTYMRGTGDTRSVATEYFFKVDKKVYRFSYFYPEKLAEEYSKVFTEMFNSFKF